MKIHVTGKYLRYVEGDVEDYVVSRLSCASREGVIENMEEQAERNSRCLGRLINVLAEAGVLSAPQVACVTEGDESVTGAEFI